MEEILCALFTVAFISSACFAQQASAPVSQPAAAPISQTAPKLIETKTFTGKVDSLSVGEVEKETRSEIVVVDDQGQKLSLRVKLTTNITAKDGKTITLSDIKKGSRVVVDYKTNKEGVNKAKSIKVVE